MRNSASYFDHLLANENAKHGLARFLETEKVPHSLLFVGSDGSQKEKFAEAFAQALVDGDLKKELPIEKNPDIYIYKPEGKLGMHSIETLRRFSEEVYLPPYNAKKKIFLIYEADRMLPTSANALLKTFEEPALFSIIILLTNNPASLLPTILSRCFTIRFQGEAATSSSPEQEWILNLLANGRMATYSQLIDAVAEISQKIEEMQSQLEESLRAEATQFYPDGLTSVQQQSIEKEVTGAVAMRMLEQAGLIFDTILSWYRDLNLIKVNGNNEYLLNPHRKEELNQAFQRGEILPIEAVQKSLAQAKLSLARSTPIANCLENLFLQLKLLKN